MKCFVKPLITLGLHVLIIKSVKLRFEDVKTEPQSGINELSDVGKYSYNQFYAGYITYFKQGSIKERE